MALPALDLPEPWTLESWTSRSDALVDEFARVEYGATPSGGRLDRTEIVATEAGVLEGAADRYRVEVVLSGPLGELTVPALLHVPASASASAPAGLVVAMSFTSIDETLAAARWPYEAITGAGFAVLVADYRDFEADDAAGDPRGVRSLLPSVEAAPWGALGAWAWAYSRLLDAAESLAASGRVDAIDPASAVAVGHSRIGKAALWAGAQDRRFAVTVSNGSGCGGAALFRHVGGEDVAAITSTFPHWFTPGFAGYSRREQELPVDQHQLLASFAPRRVYVASAIDDAWADPIGEQLAVLEAGPAFAPFGHPPGDGIGGHLRSGGHDLTEYDWVQALAFARRALSER